MPWVSSGTPSFPRAPTRSSMHLMFCLRVSIPGNLVIYRQGSGGGESAPPVLVQGHVDMVCEKNAETSHDFYKDPIQLVRDGDWIRAAGTTLGADNGIGVAAAMSLLEQPQTVRCVCLACLICC